MYYWTAACNVRYTSVLYTELTWLARATILKLKSWNRFRKQSEVNSMSKLRALVNYFTVKFNSSIGYFLPAQGHMKLAATTVVSLTAYSP